VYADGAGGRSSRRTTPQAHRAVLAVPRSHPCR
jgi:hypothetical protein